MFSALSKWRECKATDAKSFFSVRESCLMHFKSKAQVHEDVSFSWNDKLFAMQKTDFHLLRAFFADQVNVRAQCTNH